MTVFFFNDTATTEIYTLSLHDALSISNGDKGNHNPEITRNQLIATRKIEQRAAAEISGVKQVLFMGIEDGFLDRKSTRLNSSHANISYAVFCLKKKHTMQNFKRLTIHH